MPPFPALVPGAGTLPVGFQGRSALVAPKGAKSLLLLFDVDAVGAQIAFEFGDVDQVEMEDGGGQQDARPGLGGFEEVFHLARATGGDHGGSRAGFACWLPLFVFVWERMLCYNEKTA